MSETDNTRLQKPKIPKLGIRKIVATVIVVFLILAILWPFFINLRESSRRSVCAERLRQLGRCMLIYSDEVFPTAENWCDLFVKYVEVSPEKFICKGSDAKIGESSYAMNKDMGDKNPFKVSYGTILLFETNFGKNLSGRQELLQNREWYKALRPKDYYRSNWAKEWVKKYRASEKVYKLRWNQSGGPEILTFENHKGQGCNIFFYDQHVRFEKDRRLRFLTPENLGELKWEVEDRNSGGKGFSK